MNMQIHAIEGSEDDVVLTDYPHYDSQNHPFILETKKQARPEIVDLFDARYLYNGDDDDSVGEVYIAEEEEVLNYRRV